MQPPSAPIPIFATWQPSIGTLVVEFNKPLQTAAVLKNNWGVRDGGFLHFDAAGFGTALGRFVTVQLLTVIPLFVGPSVSYAAAPADLIGINGLPVAAFAGFPFTPI